MKEREDKVLKTSSRIFDVEFNLEWGRNIVRYESAHASSPYKRFFIFLPIFSLL